jgi:MFS superfamily sulfate permease-like transporter
LPIRIHPIDMDAELAALGAANIASALGQGFAVTDADSRTAIAYASGGRTQMTGLVAAACMGLVLLFASRALQYVPVPALGAILIVAAVSLFDVASLRHIWRVDKGEVALSLITTLGVVLVGPINGILVACDACAGAVHPRYSSAQRRDPRKGEGNARLPFHRAASGRADRSGTTDLSLRRPDHVLQRRLLKERALAAANTAGPALRWFVVDAIPITSVDVTGWTHWMNCAGNWPSEARPSSSPVAGPNS